MSALKRLGFSGVITKKMIITTSSTSISGVTLMNGTARPPPPVIPIRITSSKRVSENPNRSSGRRGWLRLAFLLLVGDQAYFINALFADGVDDVDYLAIAHLNATLDINDAFLFLLVSQGFFHLTLEFVETHLLLAQVVFAVVRDRDNHRTLRIDRCVFFRISHITRER